MPNDRFGFSTGALEKSDFQTAVEWMRANQIRCVELSALRLDELQPLVDSLGALDLDQFVYISFHAPSSFPKHQEKFVVDLLTVVARHGWNIVVHPDVISTPSLWQVFGRQLLLENMDRRKSTGRNVEELTKLFEELPDSRLCLDLAHARQLDTTLGLLHDIVKTFKDRIAEVHISELDSRCSHRPLSESAVTDYQYFAQALENVPVIIESVIDHLHHSLRLDEVHLAEKALTPNGVFEQLQHVT
ncbi:MAG: Xylose isomerase domain protein barrel [Planctomycetaceae bacterium]|nr:Xylose isomerase domain protein barrel [Planctomycetaceae bacterium]